MLDILAHMDQRDSNAALVVVTAVVCAWLVFLVTMLSRCVLFDCRQARVAGHHGETVQIYVLEQFLDKVVDSPVAPVEPPQVHFLDEVIVISTMPWSRQ